MFVHFDVFRIKASTHFSSVWFTSDRYLWGEQAQDGAQVLDALQDALIDAPVQLPQNRPPPSPQNPHPAAEQSAPQLQAERAQLLQNLLNAIPIASSDQITRMLQVFAPHNDQPSPSGHNNRAPAPHPYGPAYSLPPRV